MIYIQVNIGRNVQDKPMSNREWTYFKWDVYDTLVNLKGIDYLEWHLGKGQYKGIVEESCHISALVQGDIDLDHLRAKLAIIKDTYQQDAIALIVGSELLWVWLRQSTGEHMN